MSGANPKKAAPDIELAGLDRFVVSDLMHVDVAADALRGKPLDIPLEQILEDPNQARTESNPGFSTQSLAELAASIVESDGVKTPISVRSKNADGFYVVNHGSRRLRASRMAGMPTIRGFIDDDHDEYDQAIENIQRESFTPMEIARFIERREARGDTRTAIAKRLGKSNSFVTQHGSLLTMPMELRVAYEEGKCRDVLTLYELNNLSKRFPETVTEFLRKTPEITRDVTEALKTQARGKQGPTRLHTDTQTGVGDARRPKIQRQRMPSIIVRYQGELFVLRVDMAPSTSHRGWIEEINSRNSTEVDLAGLQIESLVAR